MKKNSTKSANQGSNKSIPATYIVEKPAEINKTQTHENGNQNYWDRENTRRIQTSTMSM
jgi:hypothetical protein